MKKMRVTLNNRIYEVTVEILEDDENHYPGTAQSHQVAAPPPVAPHPSRGTPLPRPRPASPRPPGGSGDVVAPIVGSVTKILVEPGQTVEANQPMIVLDAMKMDTFVNAEHGGTVAEVHCKVGDNVQAGQKLISFQ